MEIPKSHHRTSRTAAWRQCLQLILVAAMLVGATACSATSGDPGTTTTTPGAPEPVPALPDGEVFALVIVGSDESGATTLGVDLAEMLTGEDARKKAVEDGAISEGEDLPNDFYISNDEVKYELLHLSEAPVITVVSGNDISQRLTITETQLVQLWNGDYTGEPVYGIAPSAPIAMDVTVADGLITEAGAIYLP